MADVWDKVNEEEKRDVWDDIPAKKVNDSWVDNVAKGFASGNLGILQQEAQFAPVMFGTDGSVAKQLENVNAGLQRDRDWSWGDIKNDLGGYVTDPNGLAYGAANQLGSSAQLMFQTWMLSKLAPGLLPMGAGLAINGAKGLNFLTRGLAGKELAGKTAEELLKTASGKALALNQLSHGLEGAVEGIGAGAETLKETGDVGQARIAAAKNFLLNELILNSTGVIETNMYGNMLNKLGGKMTLQQLMKAIPGLTVDEAVNALQQAVEEGTQNQSALASRGKAPYSDIINPFNWTEESKTQAAEAFIGSPISHGAHIGGMKVADSIFNPSTKASEANQEENDNEKFVKWLDSQELSEEDRAEADRIISEGSADEFEALKKKYNYQGQEAIKQQEQRFMARRTPIDENIEDTNLYKTNAELRGGIDVLNGWVHSMFGKDMLVSGGARSKENNDAVGGHPNSEHLYGEAVDLDISSFGEEERKQIEAMAKNMGFNALYHDAGTGYHLHLGMPKSGQFNLSGMNIASFADIENEAAILYGGNDYLAQQLAEIDEELEALTKKQDATADDFLKITELEKQKTGIEGHIKDNESKINELEKLQTDSDIDEENSDREEVVARRGFNSRQSDKITKRLNEIQAKTNAINKTIKKNKGKTTAKQKAALEGMSNERKGLIERLKSIEEKQKRITDIYDRKYKAQDEAAEKAKAEEAARKADPYYGKTFNELVDAMNNNRASVREANAELKKLQEELKSINEQGAKGDLARANAITSKINDLNNAIAQVNGVNQQIGNTMDKRTFDSANATEAHLKGRAKYLEGVQNKIKAKIASNNKQISAIQARGEKTKDEKALARQKEQIAALAKESEMLARSLDGPTMEANEIAKRLADKDFVVPPKIESKPPTSEAKAEPIQTVAEQEKTSQNEPQKPKEKTYTLDDVKKELERAVQLRKNGSINDDEYKNILAAILKKAQDAKLEGYGALFQQANKEVKQLEEKPKEEHVSYTDKVLEAYDKVDSQKQGEAEKSKSEETDKGVESVTIEDNPAYYKFNGNFSRDIAEGMIAQLKNAVRTNNIVGNKEIIRVLDFLTGKTQLSQEFNQYNSTDKVEFVKNAIEQFAKQLDSLKPIEGVTPAERMTNMFESSIKQDVVAKNPEVINSIFNGKEQKSEAKVDKTAGEKAGKTVAEAVNKISSAAGKEKRYLSDGISVEINYDTVEGLLQGKDTVYVQDPNSYDVWNKCDKKLMLEAMQKAKGQKATVKISIGKDDLFATVEIKFDNFKWEGFEQDEERPIYENLLPDKPVREVSIDSGEVFMYFDKPPVRAFLNMFKNHYGFKWDGTKKAWYAPITNKKALEYAKKLGLKDDGDVTTSFNILNIAIKNIEETIKDCLDKGKKGELSSVDIDFIVAKAIQSNLETAKVRFKDIGEADDTYKSLVEEAEELRDYFKGELVFIKKQQERKEAEKKSPEDNNQAESAETIKKDIAETARQYQEGKLSKALAKTNLNNIRGHIEKFNVQGDFEEDFKKAEAIINSVSAENNPDITPDATEEYNLDNPKSKDMVDIEYNNGFLALRIKKVAYDNGLKDALQNNGFEKGEQDGDSIVVTAEYTNEQAMNAVKKLGGTPPAKGTVLNLRQPDTDLGKSIKDVLGGIQNKVMADKLERIDAYYRPYTESKGKSEIDQLKAKYGALREFNDFVEWGAKMHLDPKLFDEIRKQYFQDDTLDALKAKIKELQAKSVTTPKAKPTEDAKGKQPKGKPKTNLDGIDFGSQEDAVNDVLAAAGLKKPETKKVFNFIDGSAEAKAEAWSDWGKEINKQYSNPMFNPALYRTSLRLGLIYFQEALNKGAVKFQTWADALFGAAKANVPEQAEKLKPFLGAIYKSVEKWDPNKQFNPQVIEAASRFVGNCYKDGLTDYAQVYQQAVNDFGEENARTLEEEIKCAFRGIDELAKGTLKYEETSSRKGENVVESNKTAKEVVNNDTKGNTQGNATSGETIRGGDNTNIARVATSGQSDSGVEKIKAQNGSETSKTESSKTESIRSASEVQPREREASATGDVFDRCEGASSSTPAPLGRGRRDGTVKGVSYVGKNFHIDDPQLLLGGNAKERFAKNKKAIEIALDLMEDDRIPTDEEKATIAAFSGWGSFGQELFNGSWDRPKPKKGWEKEDAWLREYLGKDNWESARKSILNAHYTDPITVKAMWDLIVKMGFKGGRILEPSMGVGNFFALMPKDIMEQSYLTGIELEKLTGKMAEVLYPDANIQIKGYQDSKTADNFYDLIIGNVPFDGAGSAPADRRYGNISSDLTLHDYFFVKGLDQLRPGGLMVAITTHGTLDKKGKPARLAMAKRAELVSAFRLPTGAFDEYAGTAVVTDILIFKKRDSQINPLEAAKESWINVTTHQGGVWHGEVKTYNVNNYFEKNPENVLGEMGWGTHTTIGSPGLIVERKEDFRKQLESLANRVSESVYEPSERNNAFEFISNHTNEQFGSVILAKDNNGHDDLYVVQGDINVPLSEVVSRLYVKEVDSKGKPNKANIKKNVERKQSILSLIEVKKAYNELLDAERNGTGNLEVLRKKLNDVFDDFVDKYGGKDKNGIKTLKDSWALKALRSAGDPSADVLASLEMEDTKRIEKMIRSLKLKEKPTEEDKNNLKLLEERRGNLKSDIFFRRVARSLSAVENPTIQDAFILTRNESQNVDIERIAQLSKSTPENVIRELTSSKAIYKTPNGSYETSDKYLAGNIRLKIDQAQDALNDGDKSMEENIKALEEVLPKPIPYTMIEVQMGAPWISVDIYKDFIAKELLALETNDNITLSSQTGSWKVRFTDDSMNSSQLAQSLGGTRSCPLSSLVEHAMNHSTPVIKTKDENGNYIRDDKATEAAAEAINEIRDIFEAWLWDDNDRKFILEDSYNNTINCYATPKYDGSFLQMAGMALNRGVDQFSLRQHQINAIYRGLLNGSGIYGHEVGTGKTYTMGGLAIESRRYGLAKKPLLLAHNANSKQVANEIQEMYPGAKILYIDKMGKNTIRQQLLSIQNNDWDLVVVPHSQIPNFALSQETLYALAEEQIAMIDAALFEAAGKEFSEEELELLRLAEKERWDAKKRKHEGVPVIRDATAKDLVRQRNKVINNIEKQAMRASKEGAISFENLGIDMILVDEAHMFKKPDFTTKIKIKGLDKNSSAKAVQLRFLTQYVQTVTNGKGVHLFTGTPLTNTLPEIFHMMTYVLPEQMKQAGIRDFDRWENTFANGTSALDITPTGEYEMVESLSQFVNVADLRRFIAQYFDVVFADDMPEMKPRATKSGATYYSDILTKEEQDELLNGRQEEPQGRPYKKIINVECKLGKQQEQILRNLAQLAQQYKQYGPKEKKEASRKYAPESPLHVETDANNAALDIRLYNIGLTPDKGNKEDICTDNVVEIYMQGTSEAPTVQAIFMDRGLTDQSESTWTDEDGIKHKQINPHYNLSKGIKNLLVEKLFTKGAHQEIEDPNVRRKTIADEIAVVDDSVDDEAKAEIAKKACSGEIRVVIGSSVRLGTGVNMQENLRAMHHLDAPWTPGDLEQRNGRGQRQGNKWNTVLEYRYLTERLDAKRWARISKKAKFIMDFMTANDSVRTIDIDSSDLAEDDSGNVDDLTESLSKAAGDARIQRRAKYEADIKALEKKKRIYDKGIRDTKERIVTALHDVEYLTDLYNQAVSALSNLQKYNEEHPEEKFDIELAHSPSVNNKEFLRFNDANDANDKLQELISGIRQTEVSVILGKYKGFEIKVRKIVFGGSTWYEGSYGGDKTAYEQGAFSIATLTIKGIRNAIDKGLAKHTDELKTDIETKKRQILNMKENVKKPFYKQDLLDNRKKQLEDIIEDLEKNPIPAPSWLTNGATLDSVVYVNKDPYIVVGHRANSDGYYVKVVPDGMENAIEEYIPYNQVTDKQNIPIYDIEEHGVTPEFKENPNNGAQTNYDKNVNKQDTQLSVEAKSKKSNKSDQAKAKAIISLIQNAGIEVVTDKTEMEKILGSALLTASEKSTKTVQFLKTSKGEVYGFEKNGKIYVDPDLLNPNTPVHEYTHLWDRVCMKRNPKLWAKGKSIMKQLPLWNEVKENPSYASISNNEDLLASEVHARLTGNKAAQVLSNLEDTTPKGIIAKLKDWLKGFWYFTRDVFALNDKEIKNITLEDWENLPMVSMLKGDKLNEALKTTDDSISLDTHNKAIDEVRAKYQGTDKWMKAPNGKPTNLTENQWLTVRTPNFKKWFGDWENDPANASKVVDENGEPLVMYHGTGADFTVFDTSPTGENRQNYTKYATGDYQEGVMFFVNKRKAAEPYAYSVDGYDEKLGIHKFKKGKVMQVFLNIRNPIEHNLKGEKNLVRAIDDNGLTWESEDGEILVKNNEGLVYATTMNANAIKSAIANNGDFSTTNNDINYQIEPINGKYVSDLKRAAEKILPIKTEKVYRETQNEYDSRFKVGLIHNNGDTTSLAGIVGMHIDNEKGITRVNKTARNEILARATANAQTSLDPAELGKFYGLSDSDKIKRGVAAFMRLYARDKEQAQQDYPAYFSAFEKMLNLSDNKVLKDKVDNFVETVQKFEGMTEEGKARASKSKPKAKPTLWDKIKNALGYSKWFDDKDSINDFTKKYIEATHKAIADEDNPYYQARLASTTVTNRVTAMLAGPQGNQSRDVLWKMLNSFYDNVMKNKVFFSDVINKANELNAKMEGNGLEAKRLRNYLTNHKFRDWNDALGTYLLANRFLEIWKTKPFYTASMTQAQAKRMVDFAPKEIKEAAELYYKFDEDLLRIMKHDGLLSKEAYDALTQYKAYCPLFRDFADDEAYDKYMEKLGDRNGFANISNGIKYLTEGGSDRTVMDDPVISMMRMTGAIISKCERNKVSQKLVALTKASGIGEFAMPAYDAEGKQLHSPNAQESRFTVYEDGVKNAYRTTPELYKALTGNIDYGELVTNLVEFLSIPSKGLRFGSTSTPGFMANNALMDTATGWVFSRNSFIPVWGTLHGMYLLAKDEKTTAEYKLSGAAMGSWRYQDRTQEFETLDEMVGRDPAWYDKNKFTQLISPIHKYFMKGFNKYLELGEYVENSNRIEEYYLARKKGKSTVRAALEAKEITTDFTRGGEYGRVYNKITPFFNARLQGLDQLVRNIKERPAEIIPKMAILMLMAAIYWSRYHDEDWWKEKSNEEKMSAMFLPYKDEKGQIKMTRLPYPHELGLISSGLMIMALEKMNGDNPEIGKNFAQQIILQTSPAMMPAFFRPMIEVQANYDLYFNSPIETKKDEQFLKEARIGSTTSKVSIYSGKASKMVTDVSGGIIPQLSPKEFEHLYRGYVGDAGRILVHALDDEQPGDQWLGMPILGPMVETVRKRFVKKGFDHPKSVDDWYNLKTELDQYNTTYLNGQKPQYMTGVNNVHKAINKINRQINAIRSSNLPEDKKQELIYKLNVENSKIARIGLKTFSRYKH